MAAVISSSDLKEARIADKAEKIQKIKGTMSGSFCFESDEVRFPEGRVKERMSILTVTMEENPEQFCRFWHCPFRDTNFQFPHD